MNSLHYKLFIRFTALIFPMILIFMILLFITMGNSLWKTSTNELQADCDNISTLIDTQIDQIDQLSKRIVSSESIKSLLVRDLYSHNADAYDNRSAFSDALFDIMKLSFNHLKLNILDTKGHYIYVGNTFSYEMKDPAMFYQTTWFTPTLDAYGKKILLSPKSPEFNDSDPLAISLCRAFAPVNSARETAVLELQLDYNYLDKKIQNAIHNQKQLKQIYVYDKNGTRIYPASASPSEKLLEGMMKAARNPKNTSSASILRTKEKSPVLYAQKSSEYSGWTVFAAASEHILLASFYQFRLLIAAISIVLILLLLFITWQIANKLTTPLKKLEQTAHALTFSNLNSLDLPVYKSTFQEIDSLYVSFGLMQKNLRDSLEDTISAYTMAADAKMLALQSQMNPHFLYNTLASIGALSEDGENEQVVQMCQSLSTMLRYMSSSSSVTVALWQEVEHLQAYIYLMKVKYEDRIRFTIDIEKEIRTIKVPKLMIQPLVENCIKYALDEEQPWTISVCGRIHNGCWEIEVRDNGCGFTPEFLISFQQKTQEIDWKKPLPALSINGMGLLNLYTRLFLTYKTEMIFSLDNLPGHGAVVTIGGPLPHNSGAEYEERKNQDPSC